MRMRYCMCGCGQTSAKTSDPLAATVTVAMVSAAVYDIVVVDEDAIGGSTAGSTDAARCFTLAA